MIAKTQNGTDQASPRNIKPTHTSFLKRHQTIINFWLDFVLLINFLLLVWVAVIVQFIFPPAESASGYLLWGNSLGSWMGLQFGMLASFFFGIVLHLMMHWTWVCGVFLSHILRKTDKKHRPMDDGQRTILGVGLLIVILNIMGVGIAAATLSIKAPW